MPRRGANPDDGEQSKLKILAWRSHFVDKELMGKSRPRCTSSIRPNGSRSTTMQKQFMERAPFAMLLQRDAVTVLGKGVSGIRGSADAEHALLSDPEGVNARLQMLASSFASIPLTLFGLALVTFLIGRVMPIDPVIAIVGDHAPPDVMDRCASNGASTNRC